jgi:hypothetical protein
MSSEIIYEQHEDYLQIKYPKYNNINEFFDSIDNAFKICKEKNYHKLILDIFDINFTEIRVIDKFLAGEKIAELFKSSNKVAVLAPKKFHDNFTEVVAANRGSLLKAFDEKKDAIKWIRQ